MFALAPCRTRADLQRVIAAQMALAGMDDSARIDGVRLDAAQSAMFARQLETIFQETYDVEYPENKGRQFFPVDSRVGPGDELYTYRTFDMKGQAVVVDNFATDFPTANVVAAEIQQRVRSLGDSYEYTIQEMRAAAKAGIPLDQKKAQAAREAMERKLDFIAFSGDSKSGLYGFFTAPGVQGSGTTVTNIDGTTYSAAAALTPASAWTQTLINAGTTTPAGIVADILKMTNLVFTNTKGVFTADAMVLGTIDWSILAGNLSHPTYNDGTILQMVLASNPTLKSVDWSPRLDVMRTNATKPTAAVWARNPRVASHIIPFEFEQFAPQFVGMAAKVPCHMRTGGMEVRYPLAIAVMNGTQG